MSPGGINRFHFVRAHLQDEPPVDELLIPPEKPGSHFADRLMNPRFFFLIMLQNFSESWSTCRRSPWTKCSPRPTGDSSPRIPTCSRNCLWSFADIILVILDPFIHYTIAHMGLSLCVHLQQNIKLSGVGGFTSIWQFSVVLPVWIALAVIPLLLWKGQKSQLFCLERNAKREELDSCRRLIPFLYCVFLAQWLCIGKTACRLWKPSQAVIVCQTACMAHLMLYRRAQPVCH